ncbi:orotidine-5'-phosphate decarboxylase [Halorhodospira halophila]|uniref:Orotidine 5'-phosphate decarboxylase n=1 Tax=Halorhodospira halophila (strain DSM 244 / SL1) TaxID=349124 RepID=PYRF_HALHL|nr:orotidine-5'-phosphate decarboxylase [Halorhodospira halophila]A1WUI3.1 RecName: Full=Orotidine 5'-phosphate decarboxylase; AltName: Full=OMP decarboxylase; Short=OMPDCase; Short=OMPdecase [Halorhodospira halophila SL1]ABM61345.1 orotidine-5'-phosphate decarboxylase [Halorhodospira halophila SL1]MBK1729072.1 orotidine-5'-phosphate decarboxylase [Halorhodospira halophila]
MSVPGPPRLVVALDFPAAAPAEALAAQLDPRLCRLKVGKELFTRAGPQLVERLHARGFEVFLDLKYHDIPNTVAGACRAAADLGVWMVNVHALGGRRMLEAAAEAVAAAEGRTLITAVTVLTSHDAATLEEIGLAGPPREAVLRLAGLAQASGLDGVVCSPEEAAAIGERFGAGLLRVTPGVRPAGAALGDQQRIATPAAAVAAGCDHLVVGRPITAAEDPAAAAAAIAAEIAAAG